MMSQAKSEQALAEVEAKWSELQEGFQAQMQKKVRGVSLATIGLVALGFGALGGAFLLGRRSARPATTSSPAPEEASEPAPAAPAASSEAAEATSTEAREESRNRRAQMAVALGPVVDRLVAMAVESLTQHLRAASSAKKPS